MRGFLIAMLFCLSVSIYAQEAPNVLKFNSSIWIENNRGYESYLHKALLKRKVPIVIVDSEEKADFILRTFLQPTGIVDQAYLSTFYYNQYFSWFSTVPIGHRERINIGNQIVDSKTHEIILSWVDDGKYSPGKTAARIAALGFLGAPEIPYDTRFFKSKYWMRKAAESCAGILFKNVERIE